MNTKLLVLAFFVYVLSLSLQGQNLTISGGNSVSTMICANGAVFAWGNNKMGPNGSEILGALGTGDVTSTIITTPKQVVMPAAALPIKQVDAGSGGHFVAMGCNGSVWGWGNNATRQVGNPAYTAAVITTPVQVVKGETPGDASGFLTGVKYISGGNDENYAILSTGELVAWGQNDQGQLGNGTTTNSTAPVYVKLNATTRLTGVTMVEAGDATGYALVDPDGDGIGTVYSWGAGDVNQLGQGTGITQSSYAKPVVKEDGTILNNIVSISAGDVMCFAIDVDGYVWSWGHGAWGQLTGIGQNLGHAYAKQVVGGETGLPFLKAKAISAGQGFGMAVTLDGRAVAWGNNGATALSGGNLGDGTTNGSGQPVYIKTSAGTPITNVATISDGDTWGFITRTDNTIWTWGDNSVGQLGIGSTTRQAYAVKINNPPTCTTPDPIPFVSMPADFYTCLPFSYVIDPGFANLNNAYKYEWYKDGVLITGATSPTYTATQATTSGTTYKVKISYIGANSPCGMTPVEGDVKITAYVPEFTAPSGLTFCPPDFKVRVNGSGTYDYYTAATGGSYLGTSYKNNFTTFPSANVTQIAGNVYTVYAQEAGNRAGMVKPITSTLTVQEDNAGHMQIKVFEDLTV